MESEQLKKFISNELTYPEDADSVYELFYQNPDYYYSLCERERNVNEIQLPLGIVEKFSRIIKHFPDGRYVLSRGEKLNQITHKHITTILRKNGSVIFKHFDNETILPAFFDENGNISDSSKNEIQEKLTQLRNNDKSLTILRYSFEIEITSSGELKSIKNDTKLGSTMLKDSHLKCDSKLAETLLYSFIDIVLNELICISNHQKSEFLSIHPVGLNINETNRQTILFNIEEIVKEYKEFIKGSVVGFFDTIPWE